MSRRTSYRWIQAAFGEVVEHSAFGPRFSGELYADDGNVATLRTTDISADGTISYSTMPLAKIAEARFADHFLRPGDLVITRSGRIGTAAVFDGFSIPVLPGAFLIRFRLKPSANPYFFRYFFNSHVGQQRLLSVAKGAAQQNLNSSNVLKLDVPVPTAAEQDAVVSALLPYDKLIANNRLRVELLERSVRLLFREWFVHLRYPGHEHDKIVDGLPEGWEAVPASTAIEINPKERVGKGEAIRYVPMESLSETGMTIDRSAFELRTKHTNVKFRRGDTLFARITPCLENGKTGFVDFLSAEEIACGSTEFIVLRGKQVSEMFTYCLARTENFRQLAIKSMTGSSGRQRVQEECFDKYRLALAPSSLLEAFDELVGASFAQIRNLREQCEKLEQGRDLLLPRLMDGRIAV